MKRVAKVRDLVLVNERSRSHYRVEWVGEIVHAGKNLTIAAIGPGPFSYVSGYSQNDVCVIGRAIERNVFRKVRTSRKRRQRVA